MPLLALKQRDSPIVYFSVLRNREMISEFELIADKVKLLTELTHNLRLENAELRRNAGYMAADNRELQQRIQLAHDRVSQLLAQLPKGESNDGETSDMDGRTE